MALTWSALLPRDAYSNKSDHRANVIFKRLLILPHVKINTLELL